MKRVKTILLSVMIGLIAPACFGCADKGFEDGFGSHGGDPASPYYCAVKSEKSEYDLSDIKMTFYYGSTFENGYLPPAEEGATFSLQLLFAADAKTKVAIKELTPEEFYTENYQVKLTYNIFDYVKRVDYPHSEVLTIPASLFTQEKGGMGLYIVEYTHFLDDREPQRGSSGYISFRYQINGDKIKFRKE